ncbi:uncharacterized protein K460DRAFT_429090 [Cucurbitaria berberidis CBS 394.84]|uniref:Uncharacterized protein n=1 Tax=Cucurbitaria berberidis CBS 394.84 TaxID=1168544 RepID=A0A9P4GPS1_9PLEO|nr:uncharacterized protein K460DRAFT_429090 [Cucurbitaria berberidis CBS 394.84]KAF1849557.1 hypothetical protein K460DRAFT_429090 [Cucurbitaria berberidis CBS 394.84]
MVEPCYFLACPIFMDNGFEGMMKGVPEDDEGLELEFLRRGLEALNRDAAFHVPTRKMGDKSREYDALVVIDDVYEVLRLASRIGFNIDRTLDGRLKDDWGNAMRNGSFSKIIALVVGVGWAEATPAFCLGLSQHSRMRCSSWGF